tara:strand:- start:1192 stop:1644 length:453 start_codon:yes stop_codon:yes gene_type:complete
MLPHCSPIGNDAICDLNVESDMPRVISQEEADSGLGGMTLVVSILAFLLLGAGVAIVVLIRRDNSEQSIFYDDDDWEDEETEYTEQKVTPILPPMAPEHPDMDAAATVLDATLTQEQNEPEPAVVAEENVESTSSASDDPWADVDHSEEE